MKPIALVILITVFSIFVLQNVFPQSKVVDIEIDLSNLEKKVNDPKEGLGQPKVVIQKGEGVISRCNYRAGSRACGTCYCLKANKESVILFNRRKLRGCARLDISQVGDLSDFVDRNVSYQGTSDFDTTFICPQHFKLLAISLVKEEAERAE